MRQRLTTITVLVAILGTAGGLAYPVLGPEGAGAAAALIMAWLIFGRILGGALLLPMATGKRPALGWLLTELWVLGLLLHGALSIDRRLVWAALLPWLGTATALHTSLHRQVTQ